MNDVINTVALQFTTSHNSRGPFPLAVPDVVNTIFIVLFEGDILQSVINIGREELQDGKEYHIP